MDKKELVSFCSFFGIRIRIQQFKKNKVSTLRDNHSPTISLISLEKLIECSWKFYHRRVSVKFWKASSSGLRIRTLPQDLILFSGGLRSCSRFFYIFLFTSHISMFCKVFSPCFRLEWPNCTKFGKNRQSSALIFNKSVSEFR